MTDFAAAPDTFPPDRFNAGVLLVKPSGDIFRDMVSKVMVNSCNVHSPARICTYRGGNMPCSLQYLRSIVWRDCVLSEACTCAGFRVCLFLCDYKEDWQYASLARTAWGWPELCTPSPFRPFFSTISSGHDVYAQLKDSPLLYSPILFALFFESDRVPHRMLCLTLQR